MERVWDDLLALTVLKMTLATVLVTLAVYQVVLMAVGYGKLRPPFLAPAAASRAHRAIGDTAVALAFGVGAICIVKFDVGEALSEGGHSAAHVVVGSALLALLVVKVAVVRLGVRRPGVLPVLGGTVLGLFVATWATSALVYL